MKSGYPGGHVGIYFFFSPVFLCFVFSALSSRNIHRFWVSRPHNRRLQGQWRIQEFCSEGVQQIQLRAEDRENGDLGAVAPLVRGSGGSCNLVQEISFHIVKFS